MSTQFDGPGHIGVHTSEGDYFYGKRRREEVYLRGPVGNVTGMGPLGTEHVAEHAYVCRGVLLDAAKYRGMERWPVPDGPDSPGIITADDVKAIVQAQGNPRGDRRERLRVHPHRTRRSVGQRRVADPVRRGKGGKAAAGVRQGRAGLRHQRVRIFRRAEDRC